MVDNQRAHRTKAGFTFQDLAAIILFIDNFDELKSIKAEGNHEDIDIELLDGSWIYAQAKMISDPINSNKNYRKRKMSESFTSLCNNLFNSKNPVSSIVYISNCKDPLGEEDTATKSFYPVYPLTFDQLAKVTQNRVEKMLDKKIENDYLKKKNKSKEEVLEILKKDFGVQIIPFDPRHSYEDKFHSVQSYVGNFLINRNLMQNASLNIMRNWHDLFRENSENYSKDKVLTKKDLLWVIVVIECNQPFNTDTIAFKLNVDVAIMDEISIRFKEVFDYISERLEFCATIWSDEEEYVENHPNVSTSYIYDFINNSWRNYLDFWDIDDITGEEQEVLIKMVLYRILTKKSTIKHIMETGNVNVD